MRDGWEGLNVPTSSAPVLPDAAVEPVEGSLDVLADYIGPNKILWATDYPHGDGFFPGAPALIARRPALSEATKQGVLAGGAMRFYGLS